MLGLGLKKRVQSVVGWGMSDSELSVFCGKSLTKIRRDPEHLTRLPSPCDSATVRRDATGSNYQ